MNRKLLLVFSLLVVAFPGCVSIPDGAEPVKNFDTRKYLGKWYEIARLDHRFERNLKNVSATYSLNPDNSIRVENRGFDPGKNTWKSVVGKAKPVGDQKEGRLKVSFFGPFYSGYNIVALDPGYRYALVAGNNLNYLWILSRSTTIPARIKTAYLQKANELGYDTRKLIWVEQYPAH